MTFAKVLTVFAGIVGVISVAVYLFGIPPELKRKMERTALKTMGENKMSYMAKDQISKIPASDQEDVKELKKGLGNAVGGAFSNPIGETGGQAWATIQGYSTSVFERASTMVRQEKE